MLEMMTGSFLKKLNEPGLEIDPEVFKKLVAIDGTASDNFGFSVATSGDGSIIVVGVHLNDAKGSNSGSVYVFTKQVNGSYLQFQKLTASDGAINDNFGYSVTTSGDGSTIIVGACRDGDKGADSGSVYIFTKQVNGSYLQTQKLTASDGAASDRFGFSVTTSRDGSIIVVGARYDDDKGNDSGSAYVFTKQVNGSYLQTQKLTASDGAAGDYFGYSVAISGDGSVIIIGAYQDDDKGDNSGSTYIFTKQPNSTYLQTQKLLAADGAAGDSFGRSIAISENGSTIIVGAYLDDDKGENSGSAYVFTKQANGSYLQVQKLVALDGIPGDFFGWSVAVSGNSSTIIIGAYTDDDKGNDSGSVYVFTKQANGNYLQTQKLLATDGAAGDFFGYSVAVSNTSVMVGAFNNLTKGAVYVY